MFLLLVLYCVLFVPGQSWIPRPRYPVVFVAVFLDSRPSSDSHVSKSVRPELPDRGGLVAILTVGLSLLDAFVFVCTFTPSRSLLLGLPISGFSAFVLVVAEECRW